MPAEESLVGYGDYARHPQLVMPAPNGGVQLFYESLNGPKSVVVAEGKATPSEAHASEHAVRWKDRLITLGRWTSNTERILAWGDGDPKTPLPKVPPDVKVVDLFVDTDGSLVSYALRHAHTPTALVWTAPDAEPIERALPPEAQGCHVVPSFDHRLYLGCTQDVRNPIYVLGKGGWERAFPDAGDLGHITSVAPDGSLYESSPTVSTTSTVWRCPQHGTCAQIADLADTKTLGGATYEVNGTDAQESLSGRTWTTIGVRQHDVESAHTVNAIYARAPDDVWVVTKTLSSSGDEAFVFHHAGPDRPRTIIPGADDERVLVRNTKPPTKWVGHCDQIFVRLGRDAEAVTKRVADIKAVLDAGQHDQSTYGISYGWDLVEGRLEDKPVAGVVVHRADVESSQAAMERAVNKLIDKMAQNPVDRPDAFCTLPVLGKKLAGG